MFFLFDLLACHKFPIVICLCYFSYISCTIISAGEEKENVILTAGMSAQYSMENKEITVVTEEDVNKLAWRTGQLRFMETPLDKVIEDLSDYYQVKIANQTKNEGARLTATFNNLPLEDVLQVVNQTLDARLVSTSKK